MLENFIIFAIVNISVGAVFIVIALVHPLRKLIHTLKNEEDVGNKKQHRSVVRIWTLLRLFVVYFLVAYFVIIGLLFTSMQIALIPTSFLFLFGGLFVLITVAFSLRSTKFIINIRNESLQLKTNLLNSFARFVPPQFIVSLEKEDVTKVVAGDSVSKQLTILFCDIRDFSKISHQISEKNSFDFLNHCYSSLTPIIEKHGGFVDQFIGDALLAVFEGSSDSAISASIEMQNTIQKLKVRIRGTQEQVRIGVGINTGITSLGALGTEERITSTVVGDSVNLASRIEGLTKDYSVPIIVTRATVDALANPNNYSMREIASVKVKGISTATSIYEVLVT